MEYVIVGFCCGCCLGLGVCEIASLYCPGWPKTCSLPGAGIWGMCHLHLASLPISGLLKVSPMPLDLGELSNVTGELVSGFPVKHPVTSALKMSATPTYF